MSEDLQPIIPEDLINLILLCLPVVSLLRFKIVCKSWCSLINSSTFISQHLSHNRFKEQQLLIMEPFQCTRGHGCFSLEFTLLSGEHFQSPDDIKLHFSEDQGWPYIIASCNGIICLDQHHHTQISLWNPATKQFRVVPKSPVHANTDGMFLEFGFGLDFRNNDYKVVRIITDDSDPDRSLCKSRVEVFRVNTSSWITIDTVLPSTVILSNPKAPFRNATYCWLARTYHVENQVRRETDIILSFDFSREVFGTIPLPEFFQNNDEAKPKLAILRERIAVIDGTANFTENEESQYQIWVLNEYGVKESWTKLYTIRLGSRSFSLGFSVSGKLIWKYAGRGSEKSKIGSFNLVTQDLTVLPYRGQVSHCLQVVNYKESLVSITSATNVSTLRMPEEEYNNFMA